VSDEQLSAEVRTQLGRILRARGCITYAQSAQLLGVQETWLRRRLNGETRLSLDDFELICRRLNIKPASVLGRREAS
jgi:hypothetical protein